MNGKQLKEWFLSIDFNPYELPPDETFDFLCRGKLGPIWYEVIEQCQNHQQINQIKYNLLYHSLKNNLENYTSFKPKIINLKIQKQKLLRELESVRCKVQNAETIFENEVHRSKINKFREFKLKQENDVLNKKLFLCKKRKELLENLIKNYHEKQKSIANLVKGSDLNNSTTTLFKCSLNPAEVEARIQSIFKILNEIDAKTKYEIKSNKQDANDSFEIYNNLFIDSNINENKTKLLPILKEKFKISDFTIVLETLIKMQRLIFDQFNKFKETDSMCQGKIKLDCDVEELLIKMFAFYNKICLKTAILKVEAKKYEEYIENYYANITNPKEQEFKILYYNHIGFQATKELLNNEFMQMQKKIELNSSNSIKNLEITKDFATFKSNIERDKQLIDKYYQEIVPFVEDINQLQQQLNKNQSLLVFNINNVIESIDKDFKHHQEMSEFKQYPLEFNKNCYFNMENTWNVIMQSSHNLSDDIIVKILDNPWTRPEVQLIKMFKIKLAIMCLNGLNYQQNFQHSFDINFFENFSRGDNETKRILLKISSKCHSMASTRQELEKSLEFWEKQPWKNVISETRLFNGKNYRYYEKVFESIYKSFNQIDKN